MIKFRIVSDSMMPLIPIGAEVVLKRPDQKTGLKRFDIIVFKKGPDLICHYVWHQNSGLDKGLTITRSLKTHEADPPFAATEIVGVVTNFKIGPFLKAKILLRELVPWSGHV